MLQLTISMNMNILPPDLSFRVLRIRGVWDPHSLWHVLCRGSWLVLRIMLARYGGERKLILQPSTFQ